MKCDYRSRKGVEKQAHTVAHTAGAKLQNVVIHLGHCNYNINNFKKNKRYIVRYVPVNSKTALPPIPPGNPRAFDSR